MSNIRMFVMSCVCLMVLCRKNFNVGCYPQTFQPDFFYTCRACRHHWLVPFYITFIDLDLAWGPQGQCKAKPLGFVFWHTFQLIRMKFDVVLKQFMLNILMLLWLRFNELWETAAVLLTGLKDFNVGTHLAVYELFWFKLGMMIDTIELDIVMLV